MNGIVGKEEYHCPSCGSLQMLYLFSGSDKLCGLPGEFYCYECRHCGLITSFPRLNHREIKLYYPNDYYGRPGVLKPPKERKDLKSWWFWREIKKKNLAITKYRGGGRLLDIGCSTGNFLYGMSLTGSWELYGLEPNPHAVDYIRTWYKFPVALGTLEDAHLPSSYFDVITMWHVLEHMPDPRNSLLTVKELLKPDGLLVVEVPNPESIDAKIFGSAWAGYDIPRHYHSFPAHTLREIALLSGYKVLEVKPSSGHPAGSLILCLKWKFGNKVDSPPWRHLLRTLGSGPVSVLTIPLCAVLKSFGYIPSLSYFLTPDG
jgi:2-polyprenyl-3-methyl-5-hydroxy-6-metoxy-1,4-benzoquinol methylase